jgi:hypothetical protein
LHSVGDVAAGLPIIGGLGILSTDDGSDPGSSPPPQKRDDADTASAEGLLGSLGDTVDGALHQVENVANGLPIIGGLGILSTDDSPPQKREDAAPVPAPASTPAPDADTTPADPAATPTPEAGTIPDADAPPADPDKVAASHHGRRSSIRKFILWPKHHCYSQICPAHRKRQENGAPPTEDADTASAEGLLGGLGDTLSGILHQVGDVASGLPIIGGLGILSTDGSDPGASPQKRDGVSMSVDQLNALRQQITTLLLQQQQAEQAAATLSAASSSLPANPADLQQRLLALQNTAQGVAGGLNLQGLLGGLPIAGGLVSNTLSNGPLSTVGGIAGGLPVVGGVLSTVGGVAGGLPVVGGIVGGGGGGQPPLGGVVGSVTGAANGLLGSAVGDASIFQNVLGGGGSAASQAFASTNQMQWPDATGLYPHTLNGAPAAPPNSPASLPSSIVYGAFGMGSSGGSPPVPPPSPASSAGSVPMDHDLASSLFGSAAAMTSTIPAPSAVPSVALEDPLRRRRVDGDVVGEAPSQVQPDDDADGFSPSMPDADYTPPLLTPSKRSDVRGRAESDMHEGGPDAVPGPQDRLSGTLKAPRQLKMFRRLLRGASVSF